METELMKAYPGFGCLVSRLKEKLSEDGASPGVNKTFNQAERDLAKARSNYLTKKILYSELQEILTDLELLGPEHGLNSEEEKVKDLLCTNLTSAELHDYLHFCPSATSDSKLFGITGDDLDRHNPVKMSLSGLVPKVEERLMQKCEDLYSYFDPSNSAVPVSDVQVTHKALSLPDLVQERKSGLARERTHLQITRHQRDKQFWSYFQKLLECLSVMESLIQMKCGSQTETDKMAVEHLTALCKLTCLKVRSANLQVLCDTYTVESVKALSTASGHLDTATSQARRQLSATNQSLHAFRRLGPEFTALAQQVAQLQKELENKRWGLEQFGERPSAGTGGSTHDPGTSARSVLAGSEWAKPHHTSRDGDDRPTPENNTSASIWLSFKTDRTGNESESLASTNIRSNQDSFPAEMSPPATGRSEDVAHTHSASGNSTNISLSQAKSQHGKKVSFQ